MKSKFYWVMGGFAIPITFLSIFFYDSPVLLIIGTVELVLIGLVVTSFVIFYGFRNWRANPYGRALMYSSITLAILADLSLATFFLGPDWPCRALVRVVLFGAILGAQFRLLQLLFHLRHSVVYVENVSEDRRSNG